MPEATTDHNCLSVGISIEVIDYEEDLLKEYRYIIPILKHIYKRMRPFQNKRAT